MMHDERDFIDILFITFISRVMTEKINTRQVQTVKNVISSSRFYKCIIEILHLICSIINLIM